MHRCLNNCCTAAKKSLISTPIGKKQNNLVIQSIIPNFNKKNCFHSNLLNRNSPSSSTTAASNGSNNTSLDRAANYGNSPGRGGVLLKGTGVGATPTKPMKFKASDSQKKKEENSSSSSSDSNEKAEPRPKSKVMLNVAICFAVATGFLLQYTKYHEMIDESANDGALKLLTSSEGSNDEEYALYTNRHHFCMSDLVAISSNSFIAKVEEKDANLIVVYNPTHLNESTKKNVDGLLSQSKSNTMVVILPNHEHHKFFGDYFYEYVFKPSRDNLPAPRVLFICQKDARERFQEEARKNVIVRKEISVDTVVNIDPELFMEFGRFAGVSKKEQAKDLRKPVVDLVSRHFDIIRFRGLDTSVEEALLYHRKSGFIVSCDLMMNLKGNQRIDENNREKAIIRLRQPELEPYVIKYSRFFNFADTMNIPFVDDKLFTERDKIQKSLEFITNLKWNGVVMAHGDPILITNEEQEKDLKQMWLNTWKSKMEGK
ncbi:predicted protein [Naegleria gruberi]|uniref:Predicted protein n=1 Tax=Naegleria gruberi TaxID=5762 RepID=D2VJE4_NAEGR|nr:uncharacterized protein NAEGRDRAFT_69009 [Naegleria gruberi]EFC43026.1 predicted protein [Naegleria gruberi]|eukprot:XP_002675770.1 predicted protein [Naegleria gruberi strain NEG-M]